MSSSGHLFLTLEALLTKGLKGYGGYFYVCSYIGVWEGRGNFPCSICPLIFITFLY